MTARTLRPLSDVYPEPGPRDCGWSRRGDDIPLAHDGFGAIHHVVVCDADGSPRWDQPLRAEPRGSVAVPVLPDGRLMLVRVFRPVLPAPGAATPWEGAAWDAMGAPSIEFPRGFGQPGETSEAIARREVREETGHRALRTDLLGEVFANTTFDSSPIAVVRVEVHDGGDELDGEVDDVLLATAEEVSQWIGEGAIRCGITLAAWSLYTQGSRVPPVVASLLEDLKATISTPAARRAAHRLEGGALEVFHAAAGAPTVLHLIQAAERALVRVRETSAEYTEALEHGAGVPAARASLLAAIGALAEVLAREEFAAHAFRPTFALLADTAHTVLQAQDVNVGSSAEELLLQMCLRALSEVLGEAEVALDSVSMSIVLARAGDDSEGRIAEALWERNGMLERHATAIRHEANAVVPGSKRIVDRHAAMMIHPAQRKRIDALAALLQVKPPCIVFLASPSQIARRGHLSTWERHTTWAREVRLRHDGLELQVQSAYEQFGSQSWAIGTALDALELRMGPAAPVARMIRPALRIAFAIGALDGTANVVRELAALLVPPRA